MVHIAIVGRVKLDDRASAVLLDFDCLDSATQWHYLLPRQHIRLSINGVIWDYVAR